MAAKHAERIQRFPLLEHTYPSPQHVASASSPSPSKLQISPVRFPSPAHALDDTPPLSMEAVSHESIWGSPTARSIDTGNTKPARDIVRLSSWSALDWNKMDRGQRKLVKRAERERRRAEKEDRELSKKREAQVKRDARSVKSSRFRTSSRTRRGSRELRLSYTETFRTVADFGTVANSLGGSPYDLSTLIHPNAGRGTRGCHPHQMSYSLQRPMSCTGIRESTARQPTYLDNRSEGRTVARKTLIDPESVSSCRVSSSIPPVSGYRTFPRPSQGLSQALKHAYLLQKPPLARFRAI